MKISEAGAGRADLLLPCLKSSQTQRWFAKNEQSRWVGIGNLQEHTPTWANVCRCIGRCECPRRHYNGIPGLRLPVIELSLYLINVRGRTCSRLHITQDVWLCQRQAAELSLCHRWQSEFKGHTAYRERVSIGRNICRIAVLFIDQIACKH